MLMCCVVTCSAQNARAEPDPSSEGARITERLPDGTLIVLAGGQEYRALPAARMRELDNALEDKRLLAEKVALLEAQLAERRRAAELDARERQLYASQLAARERETALWRQLFEKADKAARPGRVRRFLDHPVAAILLEAVVPVVTLALRMR
jgi:hypothetical protein